MLCRFVCIQVFLLLWPVVAHGKVADGSWQPLGTLTIESGASLLTLKLSENVKRSTAIRLSTVDASISIKEIAISYATGRVDFLVQPLLLKPMEPTAPLAERDQGQVIEAITVYLADSGSVSTGQITVLGYVIGEHTSVDDNATQRSPIRDFIYRGGEAQGKFVELDVYFATTRARADDRAKNGINLASFNGEQGTSITFGKAVVTVPRERDVGTIPRPYLGFVLMFRKEDPTKEFTLAKVDVLDASKFFGGIGSQAAQAQRFPRQAFVFVHGFNVSFDDAVYHTAQLAHDIAFDGPAILFSWASRGSLTSYLYDRDTAKASRNDLQNFLAELAKNKDIDAVNIVAHSMGNDPLVDVLNEQATIKERGGQPLELKLKEIVFASPDVGRGVFSQLSGRLRTVVQGGGTLYAAGNDLALRVSDGLAHERAGFVSNQTPPVIVKDVETIDMTKAGWIFSLNHSTFSERRHMIDDIELLFKKGLRPPHERYKVFRPVDLSSGERYWQYE